MIKKSFLKSLTGALDKDNSDKFDDDFDKEDEEIKRPQNNKMAAEKQKEDWEEETVETAELSVDVYQKGDKIIIKTMVAGVKPDNLDVSISRDMVTITGSRKETETVAEDGYFQRELYWGSFSRTISLPDEVDVENAEAVEDHGVLTITLPKANKSKKAKLKVKSA